MPINIIHLNVASFNQEVFENLPLIHYLEYGVHVKGITRSQIEKIEVDATHYKMDQYGVWYKKLIDDV